MCTFEARKVGMRWVGRFAGQKTSAFVESSAVKRSDIESLVALRKLELMNEHATICTIGFFFVSQPTIPALA
jgi:hypothetical protein